MRRMSGGSLTRAMLGAVLIIVVACAPVLAGPKAKAFDRSDNDFSFTYSPDGRIRAAFSSAVFRRGDKVSFFTYVRERRAGAPEGRRLKGVLEFTLSSARPVRYDGTFSFVVKSFE